VISSEPVLECVPQSDMNEVNEKKMEVNDPNEVNDLFEAEVSKLEPRTADYGAQVEKRAEAEFVSYTAEFQARASEKEDMIQKLKRLRADLRRHGNIKNTRLRALNAQRAAKRKQIKCEIELCELRLREIGIEEDHVKQELTKDEKTEEDE